MFIAAAIDVWGLVSGLRAPHMHLRIKSFFVENVEISLSFSKNNQSGSAAADIIYSEEKKIHKEIPLGEQTLRSDE